MENENIRGKMMYYSCVYSGISNNIDFEMKYGTEDRTEELQYCVDKYCEDFVISGNYLKEKLEEYKQAIQSRQPFQKIFSVLKIGLKIF